MCGEYGALHIDTIRRSYVSVSDDGKVNNSNKNVVGAYKVAWRVITASPSQEFKGR